MSTDPARRAFAISIALGSLTLVLAACGDGGDPGAQAPSGATIVGAAGGSVDGPAGTRVVVPAGALTADTTIAIAASAAGAPALPAGFVSLGSTYAFTPHGTTFAMPVTVTLPIEAGQVPAGTVPLLFKTDAAGQWQLVPGASVQGTSVVAQVSGFSWFNLGQLPPGITRQPADATVLAPATADFSVVATGNATGYQWQRSNDGGASWTPIAGATQAAFTTGATSAAPAAANGDDGAKFRVVVSNAAGTSTSQAATLAVSAPPATGGVRIAAGSGYSIAALASGVVDGWGAALDGLGLPDRLVPAAVAPVAGVVSVAAGTAHALALRSDGTVWAWGYNGFGQLCNGSFDPPPHGLPVPANGVTNVIAIAAGSTHSVFLKGDGTVWTVGSNRAGQLGHGDFVDRNLSKQVPGLAGVIAIAAGGDHTLALRGDGTVWAWGENINGQLGDGTSTNRASPVQVAGVANAMRIAAGDQFSLALVREQPADPFGSLWGWGLNDRGQLAFSVQNELLLTARRTLQAPLVEIAAGSQHTLLLYFDGTLFASGDNTSGQLGDPGFGADYADTPRWVSRVPATTVAVAAGGGRGHSLALAADGSVWAWGDDTTGELGRGSEGGSSATPQSVSGLNLH